jgi:hypothetical protein
MLREVASDSSERNLLREAFRAIVNRWMQDVRCESGMEAQSVQSRAPGTEMLLERCDFCNGLVGFALEAKMVALCL